MDYESSFLLFQTRFHAEAFMDVFVDPRINLGAIPTMQTVTAETNIPTPHSIEIAARTLVLIDKAFAVLAGGALVDLRCGPMNALQIERDKLINGADERPESKAAYDAADRILYIIQSGGKCPFEHRNPRFGYDDPADDEERCNGIPSPRLNPVEYRNRQSDEPARTMTAVAGEAMEAGTCVSVKDGVASAASPPTVEQQLVEAEQRMYIGMSAVEAGAAAVEEAAAEVERLQKLVKPAEHKVILSADEYEELLRNQKKKGGRKPKRK